MNILYWPHIKYRAQFFLRYMWPASRLQQHGHGVKIIDPRLHHRWAPEEMAEDFLWADIVVAFYPKTRTGPRLVELCEQFNKKLILDVDDFSFAIHPSNEAYGFGGRNDIEGLWTSGIQWRKDVAYENHRRWVNVMGRCDAMSVTTNALADLYGPFVGHPKLWVLPNSLDLTYYRPWKRRHDDQIRIGWQGGSSHYVDIQYVREPLRQLVDKYNIKPVFLGQIWDHMKEHFPDAEYHPWVDSDTYPLKLGSLDLDIGLCPIEDDLFSRGKSNLKMIEYGAYEVPSVCSRVTDGPYNSEDMDGEDRFLVDNNDEDWYEKLEILVKDASLRKEMGLKAKRTVSELYNIDVNWKFWEECYGEIQQGVVDLAL